MSELRPKREAYKIARIVCLATFGRLVTVKANRICRGRIV
jgi:hypothetical protein